MKILHVTQGYAPALGGVEWLIQQVSEELVHSFGDEVTVFTTNCYNGEGFWNPAMPRMPVGWSTINDVQVRRFGVASRLSQALRPVQKIFHQFNLPYNDWMRTYFGGPIVPGLKKAIKEYPADLICAASFPLLHMYTALDAARETHRPIVYHGSIHPQDRWGFARKNIIQAVKSVDRYMANTDFEVGYLKGMGVPEEKMTVVGCGVHPDRFANITTRQAREKIGLPLDRPVVGFIGQIGSHKGIDMLVKAMPIVWETYPDVHLLIAGGRAMFANQLDRIYKNWPSQYRNQTTLLYNFTDDVKPYLFNAPDVFTYPSGFESFGISYLEAWASHKPVIGTWHGAIPYVVDAGKDGVLVPFQNCKLLAEAIMLLLKYPEWAKSMGEAGYKKVVSQYTWLQIAGKFRETYLRALARGNNEDKRIS
jgi:glycosyltransferase involved in cell wall biosynthesis